MSRKGTKVTTAKARINYVNLEAPKAFDETGEAKYSLSVLVPKTDGKTLMELGEAMDEVGRMAMQKWGYVPADLRMPLRDGDFERAEDKAYQGQYFFNANSRYQPLMLNESKQEVKDPKEIYSGCYGRVVVQFYLYDAGGRRGIGCQLLGIQKVAEGEVLGVAAVTLEDFEEEWF